MGLFDYFKNRDQRVIDQVTKAVTGELVSHVDSALSKANTNSSINSYNPGLKRYSFSPDIVNGNMQSRKKPGSNIAFETLRRFSVSHEVTRACINYRKRQITGLEWDIVTADHDDTNDYDNEKAILKDFINNLGGSGSNYRKFMDRFIEDLMVLDAIALEKQFTRGSTISTLIPIDAATIRLRVDKSGALPEPPDFAYVQVINGTRTAELTTDEMIYDMMNPRNDSPYGLAPLESLMITVTSSLKASMYNLAYLTDGNTPEGIYTLPEGWTPTQIKEFQEYFDALMAGDETMTRRLKFMPDGTYTPTMKPNDMAWEQFNDWLTKITCALFEVQPIEIGFSPKTGLGGKGFSEQQSSTGDKKGLMPLANFIEEVFTGIIQKEFGFTHLKFEYSGLLTRDEKSVAEVNEILIRSGQRTINEVRTDDGLDEIEGLSKPFFAGQVTYLDQEAQDANQANTIALQSQLQSKTTDNPQPPTPEEANANAEQKAPEASGITKRDSADSHVELVTELRTFRKYALARAKAGKSIRPFESNILPTKVVTELNERIEKAADAEEVKGIFTEYMNDYQISFLEDVQRTRKQLERIL